MKDHAPTSKGEKASTRRKSGKQGRRPSSEESVSHVIRVQSWEFYYSRHATEPKSKWETGPITEFATLAFFGEVVRPERSKYKNGKLTFAGREDLLHEERGRMGMPIGSATARGEEIEGYIFVPDDRLRLLLTAAQSGRIETVQFRGPKLRYGGGVLHSVSIDTHFNEEDW